MLVLSSACGTGRLVRRGQVNEELVADVKTRLTAIRGLEFRHPVPVRALGPAEVAAAIDDEIARAMPSAEVGHLETVYATLGLVAPDTALAPALRGLLTSQLAAFYDPRTKTLAISTEAVRAEEGFGLRMVGTLTGHDPVGELMIAHELTHALQDQYWGIPTEVEPATNSHGDRLLARRALLEGDATWASFACVTGGTLDAEARARVLRQLRALSNRLRASYPDAPELLRDSLVFQYEAGTAFVDRLLAHGGWAAVNRAQADPPESTEQVLHPERYLDARDRPVRLELGASLLEPDGFTLVAADTLGEMGIRILAGRSLPKEKAEQVAAGWGGDRLAAFARGRDLVIVWLTAWDSEADAVEFADAFRVIEPSALLQRRGARVLVVLGPAPPALPARVWRAAG